MVGWRPLLPCFLVALPLVTCQEADITRRADGVPYVPKSAWQTPSVGRSLCPSSGGDGDSDSFDGCSCYIAAATQAKWNKMQHKRIHVNTKLQWTPVVWTPLLDPAAYCFGSQLKHTVALWGLVFVFFCLPRRSSGTAIMLQHTAKWYLTALCDLQGGITYKKYFASLCWLLFPFVTSD